MGASRSNHDAGADASPKSPQDHSPSSSPGQCKIPERVLKEFYQEFLKNARENFDRRYELNACPAPKDNDFVVKGLLGQGGYADVYLITHRLHSRDLALKVMCKPDSKVKMKLAINEKKTQFALQSPFILSLLYAFQDSKNLYMILERAAYGDVGSEADPFYRNGDEESFRLFAAQMALGLEYLHSCCILHRDLKPGNILVFEDSFIKITDFGCAKQIGYRTSSYLGSPAFMAPELHRSQEYGREVDWWALGCIIYLLAYQRHPFVPFPIGALIDSVLHDAVTFPKREGASMMNSFIGQLLEKHRSSRLGTQASQNGARFVKTHPWLSSIDYMKLLERPSPNYAVPLPKVETTAFEFKRLEVLDDYGDWNEF